MVYLGEAVVETLDPSAANTLNESARLLAARMEEIYDMANRARRAKSEKNRRRTSKKAVPAIDVGDFVLYAKHKRESKLDYTWLGPAEVTNMVNPFVFTIRPSSQRESVYDDL